MFKRITTLCVCTLLLATMLTGCQFDALSNFNMFDSFTGKSRFDDFENQLAGMPTLGENYEANIATGANLETMPTIKGEKPTKATKATKAPQIATKATKATTAPTKPVDKSQWKAAYLAYIQSLESEKTLSEYRLVHVDNDGIPELFISGSCEAAGSIICSYKNNKVVSEHLRRLGGATYIPGSGLVHNFNGNMGYYTTHVFELTSSGFTCKFAGLQEETYEEVINEKGETDYLVSCTFYLTDNPNSTPVSEEDFRNAEAIVYNQEKAQALYTYNGGNMSNYSEICALINKW